jgi:hypothetical protein
MIHVFGKKEYSSGKILNNFFKFLPKKVFLAIKYIAGK